MKKRRTVREGKFAPHPDDSEAVLSLDGTKCSFQLNPKGQIWHAALTPRVGDQRVAVLSKIPKLISVSIGSPVRPDASITNKGVIELLSIPNISALTLNNLPHVSDAIAPVLAKSNVRWLCLNCETITDQSMEHIASMTQLLRLSLIDSSVTEKSVPHLLNLKNLRHLNLDCGGFEANDLMSLQAELPRCKVKPCSDA